MSNFELISLLITLAALFSYLNHRLIRLPASIGVMVLALLASLAVIALGGIAQGFRHAATELIGGIDFNRVLLHGLLAFLLFAGSLRVDLNELASHWRTMTLLAVAGTVISSFLVAALSWLVLHGLHWGMPFVHCLLFGALISPTDPVAVLGIVKRAGGSGNLSSLMAGESLFNDGIGVVIFIVVLELAGGGQPMSVGRVALLLLREIAGGTGLGLVTGVMTYQMLKRVDHYPLEAILTLALAMGSYALADAVQISAPIAVVVAGLFIGNQGRAFAMSDKTRAHLDSFWELIDETLNAVLFLLIGLQVLVLPFSPLHLLAGAVMIPVVLLARWVSVGGIVGLMSLRRPLARGTTAVLTWGGLRGGIAVALALSLPTSAWRTQLLAITYAVVVFSIIAQGLTIGFVIRRTGGVRVDV